MSIGPRDPPPPSSGTARLYGPGCIARRVSPSTLLLAVACLLLCAPLFLPEAARSPASDFDSHLVPYAAILRDPGAWQWDPFFGLGQPTLADPLTNLFNPVAALILLGLGPERGLGPLLFLALLATALVVRRLCRELGCGEFAATFGALVFALSGFVAGHLFAGHLEFILSLPALPLAWLAGRRLGQTTGLAVVLGAVAIALPLLSGAAYFAEYAAVILAAVAAVHCGSATTVRRRLKVAGGAAGAVLMGALLASIHLLPMASLFGQLTRMPVSAAGSLPIGSTLWSLLLPPWALANKGIDAWLEGQPLPTVGWYELSAFIGPLVLATLVGLPRAWRKGRRPAILEAGAVLSAGLLLLDARNPLLPASWLLQRLPEVLVLRVPARALGIITLATAILCALGLETLLGATDQRAARRWRRLAVLAVASLLPASGFVLLAQAYVAGLTPAVTLARGDTARVLISGGLSQLALVEQGAAVLNNYYGWYLPPGLDAPAIEALATVAALAPGHHLTYDSMSPLAPPAWLPPLPARGRSKSVVLVAEHPAPVPRAFLTAGPCLDVLCPVAAPAAVSQWGNTTVLTADAGSGQTLVVSEAAAPGWRLSVDGAAARPVAPSRGVLAIPAVPGRHRYTFTYVTPGLAAGALGTLTGLVVCVLLTFLSRRTRDLELHSCPAPVAEADELTDARRGRL